MAYPGNTELSPEAQERVLSTFREVIRNIQAGRRDEAKIGLEFVLRLDPEFAPAVGLQRQMASGSGELDLGSVLESLAGPAPEELETELVRAVELFSERHFLEAKEVAEGVLRELPGHQEARQLLGQIQEALKLEAQVAGFLSQAREALDRGEGQEAANFVTMAQALDPNHPGISPMLAELQAVAPQAAPAPSAEEAAAPPAGEGEFDIRFETIEDPAAQVGGAEPQEDDGFQFEFGSAAEFEFGESAGEAAPPQEVPAGAAGEDELFSLSGQDAAGPGGSAPSEPGGDEKIAELLGRGQEAFDAGEYQEAIDVWSRIYLIDPSNDAVSERIDTARARLEERSRELELLLHDATEAAEAGRTAEALEIVTRVLEREPGHIEALDLKKRLEQGPGAATAAEPAASSGAPGPNEEVALPEIEDDLFREELPTQIPTPAEPLEIPDFPEMTAPAPVRRKRFPARLVAVVVGALLVVALGAWFGTRILSGHGKAEQNSEAAERAIRQAARLYRQGRIEEAIHILQEARASSVDQQRIAMLISRYQKAIQPPTPTPVPAVLGDAETAAREGRWLTAYTLVLEGLRTQPKDPGLLELKEQIVQQEPLVQSFATAADRGDAPTALSIVRQLAERYPDDPTVAKELDKQLFNAAVAELKQYNLTGAHVLLKDLAARHPDDEEVGRILEFIRKYRNRPVDMRLKIFISTIELR